jgi:hypothetical protein
MATLPAVLAALALAQQTDTTFAVSAEARLDLGNYAGEVVIRTWERQAVRLRATHSSRDRIAIAPSMSVVRVRAESWRGSSERDMDVDTEGSRVAVRVERPGRPSIVNFDLTVPARMALDLSGPYTDVRVEGAEGEVTVKVNEGDVTVRGGAGNVSAQSVEGDLRLENTRGRVRAVGIDGSIWILGASGEVFAETTDGSITLERMNATTVEASSVDGDIVYAGPIEVGGWYSLVTHDGDVRLFIPEDTSARITVARYEGEFVSDFPVTLPPRSQGRRATFTLGAGSARIEVETFEGDIEIRRLRTR